MTGCKSCGGVTEVWAYPSLLEWHTADVISKDVFTATNDSLVTNDSIMQCTVLQHSVRNFISFCAGKRETLFITRSFILCYVMGHTTHLYHSTCNSNMFTQSDLQFSAAVCRMSWVSHVSNRCLLSSALQVASQRFLPTFLLTLANQAGTAT